MRASKEEAINAGTALNELEQTFAGNTVLRSTKLKFNIIRDFIDAAHTKLPTEASYQADKQRRRKKCSPTEKCET
jgi:hypothetical protein